jgi:hypothetical protein
VIVSGREKKRSTNIKKAANTYPHPELKFPSPQVTPPKSKMASTSTESTIVPIFIKREVGKSFRQMKSKEIAEIVNELEEELGFFEKGGVSIATGGDLFIRPATKDQQLKLLKVNYVHKGKIMVTCKLPNAASG